jgi:1-acyl-sn-glycerol-3-phosphate acyltransferase
VLLERAERVWRRFGVGFFLALLGLGGTLMALTLFPLVALTSRNPVRRRKRIQRMIQQSFRLYCAAVRGTRVADVEFAGIERLRGLRGTVIIANHPSLLDVVMIMSVAPDVQCVVNGKLWRNPFLRLTVEGAGYIRNDLPAETLMEACIGALQSGSNLVIFPEGTRTRPGQPIRFRRGFANIATLAEADLQLVRITCDPPLLFKGNPWWRVPEKRTKFRMEVGDRVAIHSYLKYRWRSLAARKLVADLENYYAGKFGHGRPGAQAQDLDRELVEA